MIEQEINSSSMKELFTGILKLKTIEECKWFFRDLCTLTELEAMAERFQVAKMVNQEESYRTISKKTGASTATVTRVAYWLHNGPGGYKLILDRMKGFKQSKNRNSGN